MRAAILENINDLFDSYDLFSVEGQNEIRDSVKARFPDISENELKELDDYLKGFYEYCIKFADLLADKYKMPFLPESDEALKDIADHIAECKKKYPEIDKTHFREFFSTVCWLANR